MKLVNNNDELVKLLNGLKKAVKAHRSFHSNKVVKLSSRIDKFILKKYYKNKSKNSPKE